MYCVQDAVRREVKEEAGVDFEPLSLIGIESQQSYRWLRFTFTGNLLTVATPTVTLLLTRTYNRREIENSGTRGQGVDTSSVDTP